MKFHKWNFIITRPVMGIAERNSHHRTNKIESEKLRAGKVK